MNALPGTEMRRLTEPASSFAAECLERLRGRVLKRGKAMRELPPEQRHDVRIALNIFAMPPSFSVTFSGMGAMSHRTPRPLPGCRMHWTASMTW